MLLTLLICENMNFLRNSILRPIRLKNALNINTNASGGLWEPDYLEGMKSKIPLYDTIDINLKGYDYPVLESYQKFLHNTIKNLDIEVEECWPLPAQQLQVSVYKPKSSIINSQYNIRLYQRVVQMTDISSLQLPIVLRAIEASLPAGVSVEVRSHEDLDEEVRYIPDSELNALKQELDDLGGPSKTKK